MRMLGPINSGVASGGAGAATATATTTVMANGVVAGVYVKYNDSPPATTDVTVKTAGTSPAVPSYNILALTNANTSGLFLPAKNAVDQAGSAITGEYAPLPVCDYITVVVAQADDGDHVDVWLLLGD